MERKRDAERKAKGKGKDGAKGAGAKEEEKKKDEGGDIIHGEGMAAAAKVIERRVRTDARRPRHPATPLIFTPLISTPLIPTPLPSFR